MDDSERDAHPQGHHQGQGQAAGVRGPFFGVPVEAMGRFVSAEGRLYPTALTDIDAFQRATSLVGLVAHELRSSDDLAAVLDRRAELIAALPTLASSAGVSLDGLPSDAVVDAASALRCRELQAASGPAPEDA
jgi:hypothetical protein